MLEPSTSSPSPSTSSLDEQTSLLMSLLPTRIDFFASRVLHLLSGSLLVPADALMSHTACSCRPPPPLEPSLISLMSHLAPHAFFCRRKINYIIVIRSYFYGLFGFALLRCTIRFRRPFTAIFDEAGFPICFPIPRLVRFVQLFYRGDYSYYCRLARRWVPTFSGMATSSTPCT